MGVRGLQSFAEKLPTVFRSVDLSRIVADYRKKHPNETSDPVIVVDGYNCMHFWVNQLEWIHGGQWDDYLKVLDDFLDAFRRIGVKLVFFFDGMVPTGKQKEWLARHRPQIESINNIFELIKSSEPLHSDTFTCMFPTGLTTVVPLALKYLFHATVFCGVDGDCDRTLASFAAHNRCLAILAQDTDFIVFPTAPYISMQHLDLTTMTTKLYCREALCQELGMQKWMLPLFACMIGTDFVPLNGLSEFHRRICAKKFIRNVPKIHTAIRRVAEYITNYEFANQEEITRRLPEIYASLGVQNVFSLDDFQAGLEEYSVFLPESNGYILPGTNQEDDREDHVLYDVLLRKVRNTEITPLILHVICHGRTTHIPSLEDIHVNAQRPIPPCVLVYRPIHRRMYALIFELKDNYLDESMTVPHTGDKLPTINTVEELWVNPLRNASENQDIVSHSSVNLSDGLSSATILHDIIMGKVDDMPTKKWAVFMACTEITISRATFDGLSHTHKSLCAILNYLITMSDVSIEMWEIETFIIQAAHHRFKDSEWQRNLQLEPYNSRAVHLAALFLHGASVLLELLRFCGNPIEIEHFIPSTFFNGRLFHYIYKCMHRNVRIEISGENRNKFQELKDAVLEGVDLHACLT